MDYSGPRSGRFEAEVKPSVPATKRKAPGDERPVHPRVDVAAPVSVGEIRRIFEARAADISLADQPMVLIAQPTRSGGTLLNQLFDGHPQLHVHPYELEIGYPEKNTWPQIDLSAGGDEWFNTLSERHVVTSFTRGYTKDAKIREHGLDVKQDIERFPFLLVPSYQRALFIGLLKQRRPKTARDVLNAYFTAYFNAWLDNQSLTGTTKRWVVAFRSGLRTPENLSAFFRDYPDGRHLSCVREPKGWIASLDRLWGDRRERTIDDYVDLWEANAHEQMEAKQRYGDAMFLCTFDRLITGAEEVMRGVASWLEVEYDAGLAVPTFNRRPIRANSSFDVESHGVITAPLDNWRQVLSEEDAARIDERTNETQERVKEIADDELVQPAGPRHAANEPAL
jgi:hypothetical protein